MRNDQNWSILGTLSPTIPHEISTGIIFFVFVSSARCNVNTSIRQIRYAPQSGPNLCDRGSMQTTIARQLLAPISCGWLCAALSNKSNGYESSGNSSSSSASFSPPCKTRPEKDSEHCGHVYHCCPPGYFPFTVIVCLTSRYGLESLNYYLS